MIKMDLSIKSGNVTFDDFHIDEEQPLENYLDILKEDMLQIEFPGEFILDVGWRPSFDIKGRFFIALIKNYDWENPIYHSSAKNIEDLKTKINEAVKII
ncbi:hypothetical protein [Pectobacterium fontis]|uniref:Uncharacterized protein n=1 Tax=Pectobacterium fontis TaxID=2558042 RepID=A0A7V8L6B1_9GAMM|nr:hypothetical protein [Pectobacterium fontis]KHN55406.1 hypothetical protein OI69_02710 [Pectobacterium fontis]